MKTTELHVLLIGSGGREHALAWKLKQSERLSTLSVCPGSDAMESMGVTRLPLPTAATPALVWTELAGIAKAKGVDLVVIGPDQALQDGAVDAFLKAGIRCFGPTRNAAKIEWSKSFAKEVMLSAHIPTARFFTIKNEADFAPALEKAVSDGWKGFVVKADGLALGKGVQVCMQKSDAERAFTGLFPISGRIVLEEFLAGQEVSLFAFCDGARAALFDPARDYKRLATGDVGPNTGGMGAFSPVPGLPADFKSVVSRQIFMPLLKEMQRRETPYHGLLFAGLMVSPSGEASVIEFNARFGDPETQALLPRMSGDLVEWCLASAEGCLNEMRTAHVEFTDQAAVYVVAASEGYPVQPVLGDRIQMPEREVRSEFPDFFFAGAKRAAEAGKFETAGGRVLGALGLGPTLALARSAAYAKLQAVQFRGMQFRTDVAEKETR